LDAQSVTGDLSSEIELDSELSGRPGTGGAWGGEARGGEARDGDAGGGEARFVKLRARTVTGDLPIRRSPR
jgi:hypothetical protein